VGRELDRFAVAEGELGVILRAHGLACDAATSARIVNAAVRGIALSLEARGVRCYSLCRGDSEAEVRRIGSVRRYLEKLVRSAMRDLPHTTSVQY